MSDLYRKITIKQNMPFCFVDMEATYAEFEEWSEQGVSDTIKHHYKKALQQMEKRKPFEESLVNKMHLSHFLESIL